MKKLYGDLNELIKNNLSLGETGEAQELIKQLSDVLQKGFFTKDQFFNVAMWKSPRPKKHYLSNSEEGIIDIFRLVLNSDSDADRVTLLTSFKGVSIAVASSLLTIINPKDYGIIDIRVWQLLHLYGEVDTKPKGQGFNLNDYLDYLSILRKYVKKFDVNVRDIERILFFHHREIQEGNLYK